MLDGLRAALDAAACADADIVVVDNGSRDATPTVARKHGARVVSEPLRGYGQACLAGIAALSSDTDTVVFLDADGSNDPEDLVRLLAPRSPAILWERFAPVGKFCGSSQSMGCCPAAQINTYSHPFARGQTEI